MEIESIAVICLVILLVLLIQIIFTFRLLLSLHHRSHERDEEHGLRTIPSIPQATSIQEEVQPPPHSVAQRLTMPGPAYPSSSRYSVRSSISDSSSHYEESPSLSHRVDVPGKGKEMQVSHSDSKYEYENPFTNDAVKKTKRKDILEELWDKKL